MVSRICSSVFGCGEHGSPLWPPLPRPGKDPKRFCPVARHRQTHAYIKRPRTLIYEAMENIRCYPQFLQNQHMWKSPDSRYPCRRAWPPSEWHNLMFYFEVASIRSYFVRLSVKSGRFVRSGQRGKWISKARAGHRTGKVCHKRWTAYGKSPLPSDTRGGSRVPE